MPPRHQTLPSAQTASARAARQSFYCELCSKGYSRMNDYEAHLSSYDHSHRQRMKDMKQMVKDPTAAARARKAEQKTEGLISIKLGEGGGNGSAAAASGAIKKGGFKKSGFKSAFAPMDGDDAKVEAVLEPAKEKKTLALEDESDTEDEDYEHYDPRKPTD
ncbi:hypothetical protein BKA67DRAFT_188547 [Truncatella angustata]|uniref:C2H2-type domain-containing protein n=1 Tax=Truncatella angustata TaxID=152316 RepID=A0A9P8USC0_9PEZI|nr:uncharacterized protein BKA67DRAFT_188547 [Truncatella angustata]KAH6657416.1 hypothetical protein BKA67DRAFT_188547 [Truncatella angustata]KAH8195306.1 hypothetical protein TruAng_010529 [Truncatella angustata]